MRYLYIDNFRGFSRTLIPIKNVNFLVGENSTGKTSVLSLTNVLSSPLFWLQQEFNSPQIQLGSFKDLVSVDSSNKKYFKIGIIQCKDNATTRDLKDICSMLMEFVEEDGLPIISSYFYIHEKDQVNILFSKSGLQYRINQINYTDNICGDILSLYKKWNDEGIGGAPLTKIPAKNLRFNRKQSLVFAPSMLERPSQTPPPSDRKTSHPERFSLTLRIPDFLNDPIWIAPIRSKPKRTYDQVTHDFSPEGDHAPYLIRTILDNKNKSESFVNFIKHFGKESSLFNTLSIEKFGKFIESPFALNIILNQNPLNISNVGYGVSQCLPVIVELYSRRKASLYLIQQPEVHLHPKAQAALGDIFYYYALKEKKDFMIETHSDYIIDRYRLNIRRNNAPSKPDSQLLFFERGVEGNKFYNIDIHSNGEYSEDLPKSFREFFIKEEMSLLGLE